MLEAQRRYLAAHRDACRARPEPHACQLAALDREIAIAGDAADIEAYVRASGSAFELLRAGWLDRLLAHARAARATADPWGARVAAIEGAHALRATGFGDWAAAVAAGSAEAEPVGRAGTTATAAFVRSALGIVAELASGDEAVRREQAQATHEHLAVLQEADPAWDPRALSTPYALRVPWTGAGRELLLERLEERRGAEPEREPEHAACEGGGAPDAAAQLERAAEDWREGLPDRPAGDAAVDAAALAGQDPAASYRPLADALADASTAEAIALRDAARALVAAADDAGSPGEALARFHADRLLADFSAASQRATAKERLARLEIWPDPLLGHHWRALLAALEDARTSTEVELIAVHADRALAVERDWNALLLSGLLAPLGSAFSSGWAGTPQDVAAAAHVSATLTGLGPRAILALPRTREILERIVGPLSGPGAGEELGALEGEEGFGLLQEARAYVRATGDELVDPATRVRELLDAAGAPEPDPAPRPVRLWDAPVELAALDDGLARPARPGVPGLPVAPPPGAGL